MPNVGERNSRKLLPFGESAWYEHRGELIDALVPADSADSVRRPLPSAARIRERWDVLVVHVSSGKQVASLTTVSSTTAVVPA